jgi:NAD(P)-dependent dehydrogenase (short-subunit alcohol dehydrogenase family)
MNARKISGAVAPVTGANRGIGRALTEALLKRGVKKVYATARNLETLSALRDARLVSLELDVTDAESIRAAAEAASDGHRSLRCVRGARGHGHGPRASVVEDRAA